MTSYIARYRNYLRILYFLSLFLPRNLSNPAAIHLAKYLSPRLGTREQICGAIKRYLYGTIDSELAWNSYIGHSAVNENNMFKYAKLDKQWLKKYVEIQGTDHINPYIESGRSVLIMTYHHHYNFLFCILFGLIGYQTSVIAMDPKVSPLYPSLKKMAEKIYSDIETHLNGGRILYVEPGRFSTRPIVRALEQGQILITANDFPDPFADKRKISLPFLNGTLTGPTGSVEIALRKEAHIVTAFLTWLHKDRFRLFIEPVDGTTVEAVMRQYISHLEKLVAADPGLWEGWRNFGKNLC